MRVGALVEQLVSPDLPRPVKLLAAGRVVDAVGNGLVFPLVTLYAVNVLKQDLTWAGTVVLLHSVLATLTQGVAGRLADRVGRKPLLLGSLLGSAALMFVIGLWQTPGAFLVCNVLLGATMPTFWPASNALVSDLAPGREREVFSFLYVANNVGVAVGAAAGGILAAWSYRAIFWINAATFLVFAAIVAAGIPDPYRERLAGRGERAGDATTRAARGRVSWAELVRDLRTSGALSVILLGVGTLCLGIVYSQLQTTLPVVMTEQGFSEAKYGLLWTLNAVLVVLVTPMLSRLADRRGWTLGDMLLGSVWAHAAGFAVVLLSAFQPLYLWFVLAMAVVTLGEILHAMSAPAAVARLSPEDRRGTYQGLAGMVASGGWMLGPLLGGLIKDRWGADALWVAAVVIAVTSLVAFRPVMRLEEAGQGKAQPVGEAVG